MNAFPAVVLHERHVGAVRRFARHHDLRPASEERRRSTAPTTGHARSLAADELGRVPDGLLAVSPAIAAPVTMG